MSKRESQSGFSAVELLISLFIAVAFIGAAYQLYAVVVKDGGDAKLRAKANDIAYDRLRASSTIATNPCTAPAPTTTAIPASELPNASAVVTITCPYAASSTSKVSVSVKYGTPQQEVVHALFVKN